MLIDIVLIIAGVAMVLYGADRLTEGASALARRMNVPEIIIGLTIVTQAPRLQSSSSVWCPHSRALRVWLSVTWWVPIP